MPSKSKAQSKFMQLVLAYKRGELKNASPEVKKAAASMKLRSVKDYTSTPTKGLPKKARKKSRSKKFKILNR